MMSVLKGFNHNFYGIHILIGVEGFGVKEVTINDVRFVGGTLWTDFALYEHSKRIPTVYQYIPKNTVLQVGDVRSVLIK